MAVAQLLFLINSDSFNIFKIKLAQEVNCLKNNSTCKILDTIEIEVVQQPQYVKSIKTIFYINRYAIFQKTA